MINDKIIVKILKSALYGFIWLQDTIKRLEMIKITGLITREYIEREYVQAIREFQCAHSEDEQWKARKTMARLEDIAMHEFGFDYSDYLEKLKVEVKKCQ